MESYESAVDKIRIELTGNLDDVKQEFMAHFGADLERFIDSTAHAFLRWVKLDAASGGNEERAIVSGLVFSAITLHIISMRLFLTGYIVAAGNIQRQVLETLALALLSSCKSLDVLARFLNDTYSANNAVRDALRHADKMKVNKDSWGDVPDLVETLRAVAPVPSLGSLDPGQTRARLDLGAEGALQNVVGLFLVGQSPYSRGARRDLRELSDWRDDDFADTALASIFVPQHKLLSATVPVIPPLPMSESQYLAIR
ncbi:MAG: hypothetical protein IH878_10980, partial [Gemmatimonadetes bacterium]|nr:hypothetical protein [Gemmatimonadota bacterium]